MKSLLVFTMGFAFGLAALAQEKSQLPVYDQQAPADLPNGYRILFIGDSITRHGTNAQVQHDLKWDHVAGMAASQESRDYVHRFSAMVQATIPDRVVQILLPRYALNGTAAVAQYGSGTSGQYAATIAASESDHPNLVVIQLGEHERTQDGFAAISANYEKLLTAFDTWSPKPIILCTGVWDPQTAAPGSTVLQYSGPSAELDKTIRAACDKHQVPFVSVESVAMNPACRGWGQVSGVQWHPNDQGHQGYADRLFTAFQSLGKTY